MATNKLEVTMFACRVSLSQLEIYFRGELDVLENSMIDLEIKFKEISANNAKIIIVSAKDLSLVGSGMSSYLIAPVLELWERLVDRYLAEKQLIYLESHLEYMLKYSGYPERHPLHVFTGINS